METLTTRPEITKIINNVSQEQGINNYIISHVQTTQKGEGYSGEIFMITVKDTNSDKTLDMVIKVALKDEKLREMVPIRITFQNEIYFYSTVNPSFEKFERNRGISHTVQLVPKCLMVSAKDQEEIIVLENLKALGFELFDKTLVFDDDHFKLMFKTYGRFHAYSFALRDQQSEEYGKIVNEIHNVYDFMKKSVFFLDHFNQISELVKASFIPGQDDEIIKKYEKYSGPNLASVFDEVANEHFDHSAILHGDCWSNNMLFYYEETKNGRKPTDMRLIDWQIMRIGSPIFDLSYCLYSGGSKKQFDNLSEYLEIYYASFSSFLTELGSDPEKLYPFSVLKENWKKYSKLGMILSFSIIRMKLTNREDILDLTDELDMQELAAVMSKSRFNEADYKQRVRDLVWHMSEQDAL